MKLLSYAGFISDEKQNIRCLLEVALGKNFSGTQPQYVNKTSLWDILMPLLTKESI